MSLKHLDCVDVVCDISAVGDVPGESNPIGRWKPMDRTSRAIKVGCGCRIC